MKDWEKEFKEEEKKKIKKEIRNSIQNKNNFKIKVKEIASKINSGNKRNEWLEESPRKEIEKKKKILKFNSKWNEIHQRNKIKIK